MVETCSNGSDRARRWSRRFRAARSGRPARRAAWRRSAGRRSCNRRACRDRRYRRCTGTGFAGSLTIFVDSRRRRRRRRTDSLPSGARNTANVATGFLRRPVIEAKPLVGSGLEQPRLGNRRVRCDAFSPLPLPFRFCMKNGSSICSRKNSPVFDAKLRLPSLSPSPRDHPPCAPRSHDQRIRRCGAPSSRPRQKSFSGPGKILGIEPAADPQDRRRHILHVRRLRAGLPEFVVGGVLQDVVPIDDSRFSDISRWRWKRAHAQIKIVLVRRAEIEGTLAASGRSGPACAA